MAGWWKHQKKQTRLLASAMELVSDRYKDASEV